jgi:heme exporter protein CcmD
MPDFGIYAFYIIGAYAVAGLSLGLLLLATIYDLRRLKRRLNEFDQ